MTTTHVTKCPQCGGHSIEQATFLKAELDDELVCPDCGHRAAKRQFIADLVDKAMDIAKNAFGKIPGFRRK